MQDKQIFIKLFLNGIEMKTKNETCRCLEDFHLTKKNNLYIITILPNQINCITNILFLSAQ